MRNVKVVDKNLFSSAFFDFFLEIEDEADNFNDEEDNNFYQRIINSIIEKVSMQPMLFEFQDFENTRYGKPKAYQLNDVEKYCFHRIAQKKQLYSKNSYTHEIVNSYYGQEIGNIQLKPELFNRFIREMNFVLGFENDLDKINYLLSQDFDNL